MPGFFITGTDTDVGKTIITTLLTYRFLKEGINVFPYKPIQSGAVRKDGSLVAPDTEVYQKVTKGNSKDYYTYLLEPPVSPHLAAKIDNVTINRKTVLSRFTQLKKEQ
jgi:dethiobiotin synthetase